MPKSIHDAGWGIFRQFLAYKCELNGGQLVKVKPHFTTQACFGLQQKSEKIPFRPNACLSGLRSCAGPRP
ncbi:zinc ribbon domain-containing protein [Domibacillus robiginosus]|uniref:zinc ribbon domain-containing protein n=1 Tax=Domibacillus robiginosus TaxID=1071054 RepID=UPI003CCBFB13